MTQDQNKNVTCDGEGNGEKNSTGNQSKEQNKEQNQDGGGAQNQENNKEGNGEAAEEGNGTKNQYQSGKDDEQTKTQWKKQYRYQIQQSIQNGTVVQECNISKKDGNVYMNSYEYQKGMEVEIEEQSQKMIQVRVQAEFKEGKVLVLNIENNAFKVENSNQIRLKFDGQVINEVAVEDVLDGKGTEAQYASAVGESGGQYIIYIPHFSEHIITLEAVGFESEQASIPLIGLGAAIITVILLILVVFRIGKYRD